MARALLAQGGQPRHQNEALEDRMSSTGLKIIIADDHPLYRVALRLSLHNIDAAATTVEADSFDSLKSVLAAHPGADLVLLDLVMPGVEGLSSLQFLHSEFPGLRVAVISSLSQRAWLRSAQALGAVAYLHKSATPEQLQEALRRLLAGQDWWPQALADATPGKDAIEQRLERLSRQEFQILLYLKGGRLNKQIASDLGISESTVKTHVSTILRKLDLNSRTQAAVLAERLLSGLPPGTESPP